MLDSRAEGLSLAYDSSDRAGGQTYVAAEKSISSSLMSKQTVPGSTGIILNCRYAASN